MAAEKIFSGRGGETGEGNGVGKFDDLLKFISVGDQTVGPVCARDFYCGYGQIAVCGSDDQGRRLKRCRGRGFCGDNAIEKFERGVGFDVLVATPGAMKDLSKLGKMLGPRFDAEPSQDCDFEVAAR